MYNITYILNLRVNVGCCKEVREWVPLVTEQSNILKIGYFLND